MANQLALERVLLKMVRSQVVASIAFALLLASGCQQEEHRPCPVESVRRIRPEVRAVAFAYGDGPVFVGLGTGDGVVRYTVDTQEHGGWYYYKTLWAIAPDYTGSVMITGSAIGSSSGRATKSSPSPTSVRLAWSSFELAQKRTARSLSGTSRTSILAARV